MLTAKTLATGMLTTGMLALLLQDAGDFSSGSKQQQTDTGHCEACDLSDLAMGVVFSVGQP
jgi:hypothetical protein